MPEGWSFSFVCMIVAIIATVWLGVGLYAMWRAGRMSDRAQFLQDLADFLDTMIRTDHRSPIWLWADGRIQADANAMAMAGAASSSLNIQELAVPHGSLPKDVIEDIRASLSQGKDIKTPIVIDQGNSLPRLILDLQKLSVRDGSWPSTILWLEESSRHPVRTNREGVRSLELQLQDVSQAFNSIPFPIWVHSADMSLIQANQAYVDAVDGDNATDVVERELELFDRGSFASVRKAREVGENVRERRFGVINGQRRAFSITNIPLDSDGNVMSIAVDVTGEEEALSELSRVLEAQSETLNRLRSPVAIFGPGQTLRFYNSAFARLCHLPEELLSSEIRHGELLDTMREQRRLPEQADFQQWKRSVLKHYTSLLEPFEEMWHLPDGTAHRVVTQPHPLGGLLILFEDVTDRLALERSYNTLIAVQQETLDNMHESIAVFGSNGLLQLSNPAFQTLWQLTPDDLDGEPHLADLVRKLDAFSEHGERPEEDFKKQLPAWVTERTSRTGRWYRADGLVVDYSIVPLPDGGVMLTQNDVTDSFMVEQALRERSSALEAADRLKSEFITSMSYELRTPLNSIIGFAEMLDQKIFGDLNDQQEEYVKHILTASDTLKDIVADVLDLAVIDAGEAHVELEEVAVHDIIAEASSLAQELARKSSVTLHFGETEDAGLMVVDKGRMKQAFCNMVSSMLNYARSGGELSIQVISDDQMVTIIVTSRSSGLAPYERDTLVSTVAMGASPSGRRATGLDLALVRSIMRLHHGAIRLAPFEEEGLSLSCTLPRTQTHNNTEKNTQAPQ